VFVKARSEILQRIKIGAEEEVMDRLLEHPFYRKEIAAHAASFDPSGNYGHHLAEQLKTGAELSRASYGTLFGLVDSASAALKLSVTARLFKSKEPMGSENAGIISDEDRVLIVFQSGILNTVSNPELLRAIVGHELGHHGFRHMGQAGRLAVDDLAARGLELSVAPGRRTRDEADLLKVFRAEPFAEVYMLASLASQLAELNADRAGLIVQPDLDAAVEGDMLLAGGAADSFGRYHARDYLAQARDLLAERAHRDPFDALDLEGTHPIGPLRALALEHFFSSDVFRELTGRGPATVKLADFDTILPWLVPITHIKPRLSGCPTSPTAVPAFLQQRGSEVTAAPPPKPSANAGPGDGAGEPGGELAGVFSATDAAMTTRERAELTWLLAARLVMVDGQASRGEEAFLASVVRPRALAEEVTAYLNGLDDDAMATRAAELIERGRSLHTRSKGVLIKTLIQAAKVDRKVHDEELREIWSLAEVLGAAAIAERELRNVFGSRVDSLLGA
jgi:Zn-dependent protease with chaperone function/uncharacterized tellurite resistance protein B-like protein